jgi:formylglycine-generating enzyme required for sulfatase activity
MGADDQGTKERPRHVVTVPDFELLQTEVTVAQYADRAELHRAHDCECSDRLRLRSVTNTSPGTEQQFSFAVDTNCF